MIDVKKDETNNLANVQEKPVDLGQYGTQNGRLTQEQMLGIGGGTEFLEIENSSGRCKVHIAMPVLLRDRTTVTNLLKEHASIMMEMGELTENSEVHDEIKEMDDVLQELRGKLIETIGTPDEKAAEKAVKLHMKKIKEFTAKAIADINAQLTELENRDFAILLKVAYHCFKRCDASLKGKTEDEAVEILESWMDLPQLQQIPDVAKGLNKLSPSQKGAAMQEIQKMLSSLSVGK